MIDSLGWVSGILFVMMTIPQLIKTFKTQDVKDISLGTWWIYVVALCLSAIYLANQKEILWPALLNQTISAFLAAVQLGAIYYFR